MNIADLFNLAGPDLIVILLIVLLLFGAKKLPRGSDDTMSERKKINYQASTAFAWAAVAVALLVFLMVVGARWAGR